MGDPGKSQKNTCHSNMEIPLHGGLSSSRIIAPAMAFVAFQLMAWIESHTVLLRHRKLVELATELGLRPVYVMGHLHALWHSALEQQEDGDLSEWSDETIASLASYQGDALKFVAALQRRGWLDGKLLHDWLDYAGKYLTAKYRTANPGKLKKILSKYKSVNSRSKVGRSPIGLSRSSKVGSEEGESEGEKWGTPRALIALYNEQTPEECPMVKTMSAGRVAKAKKYLKALPSKDFWESVFSEVHKSKFLRGLQDGGRVVFDFDWMLTVGKDGTENAVKTAEGKYQDKKEEEHGRR